MTVWWNCAWRWSDQERATLLKVSELGWHFTGLDHAVVPPYFVNDVWYVFMSNMVYIYMSHIFFISPHTSAWNCKTRRKCGCSAKVIILRAVFQLPGSINDTSHCCCSPMHCRSWAPLEILTVSVSLVISWCKKLRSHCIYCFITFHFHSIVLQILLILCMPEFSLCLSTGQFSSTTKFCFFPFLWNIPIWIPGKSAAGSWLCTFNWPWQEFI